MRSASITQPEVRKQILEVAEGLFRTLGYAKTTVADIARACDMSPANVYRFFESKATLNEAITELILAEIEQRGQVIACEQRPVGERLRKLLLEVHGFVCERYINDSRVHEMVAKAMDEQWGVIDAHINRMHAGVRSLIEEGMNTGEFRQADLNFTAACVNNAMMAFCHPQVVAQKFAKDQKRQAVQMGEFLVRALTI